MPSVYFSDKRYVPILFLLSLMLSACGGSQPSIDLPGDNQLQDGLIVGTDRTSEQSIVTLTGRAVKGIVQNALVSAYSVQSGQPVDEVMESVLSDENGQFSIHLPRWKFRQLVYLEISAASSVPPSRMICDAYSGCGSRSGLMVRYGDSFPLTSGILMRNVAMLKEGDNTFVGNFSPLRHAAVARAEHKADGLTWSNMQEAESELADLFLFAKPISKLTPVNLLSISEAEAASDEQLVLAILESAFLNIGESPNYVKVETLLSRITNLNGQFQSHVSGNFRRLSLHNLLRAAYYNIPGYVAHRPGVTSHIQRLIQARAPGLEIELGLPAANDITGDPVKLQVLSNDGGSVKVLPLDTLCSMSCEYVSVEGESFSLSPVSDEGYEFSHWEEDCADVKGSCDVQMDGQKTASAVFKSSQDDITRYSLTLNISGAGQVVEQNSSSLCSGKGCNALLEQGQTVILVASAYEGYQFNGWSGDCSGAASCELTINGNKIVAAQFSPILVPLTLSRSGSGSVSSSSGLNCSTNSCQFNLPMGETVSLDVSPASGFQFDSWGGACSGKSGCTVTMDSSKQVEANFTPIMHKLTVTASSGGLIGSGDQSLMCGESTCVFNLAEGSSVDLKALAKTGYQFESWAGACSGGGACLLELKQDITVYANFSPIFHTLTISVSEGGSVASLAADLNCSEQLCIAQVQEGSKITLSALPFAGYELGSWSEECDDGSSDCAMIVASDVMLSATFNPVADQGGSILVAWSAPLEREDGSPLSAGDIQSYTIYYSETSGEYRDAITVTKIDNGIVPTSVTLHSLQKGSSYYVAGITVDTKGVSSQLSNEIVKTAN